MSTAFGMSPPRTWETNGHPSAPAGQQVDDQQARESHAAKQRVGYSWGPLRLG
jgi:hypothetical protein